MPANIPQNSSEKTSANKKTQSADSLYEKSTLSSDSVSDDSAKLWSKIIKYCNLVTGGLAVILSIIAVITGGTKALFSVLLSWIIVAGFFTLSLAVVDYFWKRKPEWAMPAAMFMFVFKFVFLAIVLLSISPHIDIDRMWFMLSALAFVFLWQIVEIVVVLKSRFFIFNQNP